MEADPRHECPDCTFVQDKETLFIFLVPRNLKEQATNKPLFFGKFTMTGWTGHSGFYLFRCKQCNQVSIDSPHGYTDFGLMYLRCTNCKEILPLEVTEEQAVYEREDLFIPKSTREERKQELNDEVAEAEARGVKVIVPELDKALIRSSKRYNWWNIGLVLLALWTLGIFLFRNLNWHPF